MKKILKILIETFIKSIVYILGKINPGRYILDELNKNIIKQAGDTEEYLKKAGFKLKHKRHSEIIAKSTKFSSVYNQIWTR